MSPEDLRSEFVRLLTADTPTNDRRRSEYNQAIFFPANEFSWSGKPIRNVTTLDMVLEKFDKAVKNLAAD